MTVNWRTYSERHKVVQRAQRLARSGQYPDHASIIPLLQDMEGFEAARLRLEERAVRSQLDRLCAMAQSKHERFVVPGRQRA
jgi:hypothetical protein